MLDWFASKIGLLVFIMIVASILLFFVFVQNDIMSNSLTVQQTNDLARIVDDLCINCTVSYDFGVDRKLEFVSSSDENSIILDGTKRIVLSTVKNGDVTISKAVLKNVDGTIEIKN